ncbi:MAG: hypothetical protein RJA36_1446 [Pseudomonadota bacterium]|jgi:lambda family phage tail tape measure protein
MAGEKVGEAYVELHYKLDQLARDLRVAKAAVENQVGQLNDTVKGKTDGMFVGVSNQIERLTGQITTLRNLAVVGFATAMISSLYGIAQQVATVGNEVQLMRGRLDNALGKGTFEDVVDLANRLGIEITTAADATSRFGMAAQDIGLTKAETIKLVEVVTQLGRVGNSSAQEMSSGMFQLAQALASGRLSGDELRSVLEQMPEVARAIARELGVGIGELRKMGSEGKLTADVVANALLGAADEAAARFAQLPESIEQSQARWNNAVKMLMAGLDQTLRTSAFFKWWNNFKTGLAEGLAVDYGGADTETTISVLEKRLAGLRSGNLLGENNRLIAEVEGQLEDLRRLDREMRQLQDSDAPAAPKAKGPLSWSLYPERTVEDEKAARDYREDAKQIAKDREQAASEAEAKRKREIAEQKRLNAEEEREQARAAAEKKRQLDLVTRQINDAADARWAAQQTLANQRRDATLEALAEEEKRWKESDPLGYYQKTGDTEFAPLYDPKTGAIDAMRELGQEAAQLGRMTGDFVKQGADTAAQALTQMALTGKLAVDDLLESLAELALNQAFRWAIGSMLGAAGNYFAGGAAAGGGGQAAAAGFARGGVFNRGEVVPLARGGIVSAATIVPLARGAALMGEAGPEAVMPLARDGQGRLGVRAGGGGGTVVNVIDQRGAGAPPVETQRSTGAGGMEQITMIIRAEVNRTIGSGGANKAMEQAFNLKPRTRR